MKNLFLRYTSVGVINTLLHWCIAFFLFYFIGLTQALSHLFAFLFSVTFSFFANAKFSFKVKTTKKMYFSYVFFMGGLSYLVGYFSDKFNTHIIIALVLLSTLSLVVGFFYSKFIFFKSI